MGRDTNVRAYRGTISARGIAASVGYTVWLLVTSMVQDVRARLFAG